MRHITYNNQRNNFNFAGTFPGYKQCFSTCAWMFICYYNKKYKGASDIQLAKYFDDVETSVGKKGIGEKIKAKFSWITGKSSYWGLVQEAGIQKYLPKKKIKFDTKFPISKLIEQVKKGPVIISTKKMGGLKGGHILLLVDIEEVNTPYHGSKIIFNIKDPYGDALTNYFSTNGNNINYSLEWLQKYIDRKNNGTCMIIYAEK